MSGGNAVITGKLGAGKSLCAVGKVKEYLLEGRKVATNLDIDMTKLVGKKSKNAVVYRIPDYPTLESLKALGKAYEGPVDDSKTGIILLDECATWLNARDWNDKRRQPMLDYLLHIRKMRWQVYLLAQDVSLIDKQFRKILAEHVVYCRRLDRVKIPILSFWYKLIMNKPLMFLKVHIGIVKYGDQANSMIVDKWIYRGKDLYGAYDTEQIFEEDTESAIFQYLPPHYLHRNSIAKRNWNFFMRISKIYARKYSRVFSFLAGGLLLTAINLADRHYFKTEIVQTAIASTKVVEAEKVPDYVDQGQIPIADFDGLYITASFGGRRKASYYFADSLGNSYSSRDVELRGFGVNYKGSCKAELFKNDQILTVYCGSSRSESIIASVNNTDQLAL